MFSQINIKTIKHLNFLNFRDKSIQYIFILVLILIFIIGCGRKDKILKTEYGSPVIQTQKPIIGKTVLLDTLGEILKDSVLYQAITAVKIVNINNGEIIYQQNSNKLMHPASNMKLFTAAAALLYLGPEYIFETKIVIDSLTTIGDTLNGDIYLVGSGDPSFSLGDLKMMIDEIYSKGIRHIKGDIICDDFYFDDLRYGSGWMWDDQPGDDFSQLGALTINRNALEVFALPADSNGLPVKLRTTPNTDYVQINNQSETIDSLIYKKIQNDSLLKFEPFSINRRWQTQENIIDVKGMKIQGTSEKHKNLSIVNPAMYFGTLFKEYCYQIGIKVSGQIKRGVSPEKANELSTKHSAPVATLVAEMNKPSDNLYAELLLKAIGAKMKGKPGTSNKGIEVLKEMLASWNMNTDSIRFADGSGVSRYNLLTADVIVDFLINMHNNFSVRNEFIASLPIGGIDGSLSKRMRDTAAQKVVHAKTGTLSGVTSLGGYTISADNEVYAFSILMSHFVGSANPLRKVQDRICDAITRYMDK